MPAIENPDEHKDGMLCDGVLLWEDGSLRGLAGFMVWHALLLVWRKHGEAILDPQVLALIRSLMSFRSYLHSGDGDDEQTGLIKWVSRQNQAARVQPITSFMWSSILKNLKVGSWEESSVLELIETYNNHPSVAAAASSGGAGTLKLEGRKGQGITNWLLKTGKHGWSEVASSGHDYPFCHGPFSETMASTSFMFVNSKVSMLADPNSLVTPQTNEAHIPLDWTLPLSERAQGWLFARKRSNFERSTVGIPLDKKKKYRMTETDDLHVRNLLALWDQMEPHAVTRLGHEFAETTTKNLQAGSLSDDDIEVRRSFEMAVC
jgi:hypothetical protein